LGYICNSGSRPFSKLISEGFVLWLRPWMCKMEPSNMSQHIAVTFGHGKESFDIVNGCKVGKEV
jgi:hypothetical protein